jgi:hypothetical protein
MEYQAEEQSLHATGISVYEYELNMPHEKLLRTHGDRQKPRTKY